MNKRFSQFDPERIQTSHFSKADSEDYMDFMLEEILGSMDDYAQMHARMWRTFWAKAAMIQFLRLYRVRMN